MNDRGVEVPDGGLEGGAMILTSQERKIGLDVYPHVGIVRKAKVCLRCQAFQPLWLSQFSLTKLRIRHCYGTGNGEMAKVELEYFFSSQRYPFSPY